MKEVYVPVSENGIDEITSIRAKDYTTYYFTLSKGDKVKCEISSDVCINILFLDEKNFQKLERKRKFVQEDGTYDVYETKSLEFTASRKGVWYVVLQNQNGTKGKAKVHLHVLKLP